MPYEAIIAAQCTQGKIIFSMFSEQDFQQSGFEKQMLGSKLTISQMPGIMFLQTPSSPQPKEEPDVFLWNHALFAKSIWFQKNSKPEYAQKAGNTLYYCYDCGNSAFFGRYVKASTPNAYLEIIAKNTAREFINGIVNSIE
ncbi:MAG: hypothetical protein AABY83_08795 [Pseudomonadota bacterium]